LLEGAKEPTAGPWVTKEQLDVEMGGRRVAAGPQLKVAGVPRRTPGRCIGKGEVGEAVGEDAAAQGQLSSVRTRKRRAPSGSG
jgi:hypothetical protein